MFKKVTTNKFGRYNKVIRGIACQASLNFGIDTPRARNCQAHWIRRIRKEYPISSFQQGELNES